MSDQHYFSENPEAASRRSEFSLEMGGRTLVMDAEAGVFSQHGLDKGTAVFLAAMQKSELPQVPDGSYVCDLGCGTGPIALALAVLFPHCTVIAIDTNARAREICAHNARRNQLENVRVCAPEEVPTDAHFHLLWSNPPIRIGKDSLHQLLLTWLARLSPMGQAHLVVSKNLGADSLTQWLIANGYPTKKMASSKGFRVLEVLPHS